MPQETGRIEKGDLVVFRSKRAGNSVRPVETEAPDTPNAKPLLLTNPLPESLHQALADKVADAVRQASARRPATEYFKARVDDVFFVAVEGTDETPASELTVVTIDNCRLSLAFDTSDHAAQVLGRGAQLLELLGSDLFGLLRGRGVGIILNAGDFANARMLTADRIEDLSDPANETAPSDPLPPPDAAGGFRALLTPQNFPDTLQIALNTALVRNQARFGQAFLLKAEYDDGKSGYLIAFSDLNETDRASVTSTVNATLKESGRPDIVLDIAILADHVGTVDRIRRIAIPLNPGNKSA